MFKIYEVKSAHCQTDHLIWDRGSNDFLLTIPIDGLG